MGTNRVIKVQCRCGKLLFKYQKNGRGRLIKCFIHRLQKDYVGIDNLDNGSKPICPNCSKELGIIKIIHGYAALKINQGTVQTTGT